MSTVKPETHRCYRYIISQTAENVSQNIKKGDVVFHVGFKLVMFQKHSKLLLTLKVWTWQVLDHPGPSGLSFYFGFWTLTRWGIRTGWLGNTGQVSKWTSGREGVRGHLVAACVCTWEMKVSSLNNDSDVICRETEEKCLCGKKPSQCQHLKI